MRPEKGSELCQAQGREGSQRGEATEGYPFVRFRDVLWGAPFWSSSFTLNCPHPLSFVEPFSPDLGQFAPTLINTHTFSIWMAPTGVGDGGAPPTEKQPRAEQKRTDGSCQTESPQALGELSGDPCEERKKERKEKQGIKWNLRLPGKEAKYLGRKQVHSGDLTDSSTSASHPKSGFLVNQQ